MLKVLSILITNTLQNSQSQVACPMLRNYMSAHLRFLGLRPSLTSCVKGVDFEAGLVSDLQGACWTPVPMFKQPSKHICNDMCISPHLQSLVIICIKSFGNQDPCI